MDRATVQRSTHTITFFCHSAVWDYWHLYLPLGAYKGIGYSLSELVDDAVSFYVYLYAETKDWGYTDSAGFRERSWELMTGFPGLQMALASASEEIDDHLRDIRMRQLFLEHATGAPFGVNKGLTDEPSLDPLASLGTVESQVESLPSKLDKQHWVSLFQSAEMPRCLKRQQVAVTLSYSTWEKFQGIRDYFHLQDYAAILIILEQVKDFLQLMPAHTDNFREDLFLARVSCQTIVVRTLEQVNAVLELNDQCVSAADIVSERLSVLKHRLDGGVNLSEFLGNTELEDIALERTSKVNQDTLSEADKRYLYRLKKR